MEKKATTPKYVYVLYRDGKELERADSEIKIVAACHRRCSSSFDWALKYEGYSVNILDENDNVVGKLTPYTR